MVYILTQETDPLIIGHNDLSVELRALGKNPSHHIHFKAVNRAGNFSRGVEINPLGMKEGAQ